MFFSKAVLISVLGLSALSVAAPIEDGVTAQAAAPATGCSWYDSITGRSCGNGGTLVTTPPRNTPSGASETEASEKKAPKEKAPKEKAPENEGEGESYWQQAAPSKGSGGHDDEE
ncbi:hypothetical protein BLS_002281 [Venturia inaequalis]|uniref:Uncharacterized protein n=1 Tax=Venturia inaequalis TaxID=5025 RepID=A0A8H3U156_VENIN|nr:hypothetical protein BLS_002281 [Venturia inaequalis]